MNRSLQIRGGIVIVVLLLSVVALLPTLRWAMVSAEEKQLAQDDPELKAKLDNLQAKAIRQGLDLQGGLYIVLEVNQEGMTADQARDALHRVREIIANRVDQFGVSEPVIQVQGTDRIIVQLPGIQDPERARNLIGQTAQLEFKLVRPIEDVQQVLQKLDAAFLGRPLGEAGADTVAAADTAAVDEPELTATTDSLGQELAEGTSDSTETLAQQDDALDSFDELAPPTPGLEEVEPEDPYVKEHPFSAYTYFNPEMARYYGTPLFVEEKYLDRVSRMLARDADGQYVEAAARVIPREMEFQFNMEPLTVQGGLVVRPLFLLNSAASITGERLTGARSNPDPDRPSGWQVEMSLDRKGSRQFSKVTGENIGRNLAITLDNRVASAPNILTKIPSGQASITGSFTHEEAADLALLLRAGALPTDVQIEEERTVGPSLGKDSIRMGVRAALYGSLFVVLFIIIYYRLSGLITVLALVSNILILLAVLNQFGLVLTLPGIAGIILTVGMAVDANVLINERIREELRKEKTVRAAVESGYANATRTIVDANVTTLIAGAILLWFGTGPIKGFAVTLSIGILTSMFTALVLTKVVMQLWTRNKGHVIVKV